MESLRGCGYCLVAVVGWAAGRWVWPGDREITAGNSAEVADSPVRNFNFAEGLGDPQQVEKRPTAKVIDGKAVGMEMRVSGSEADFGSRARQMALEPPQPSRII